MHYKLSPSSGLRIEKCPGSLRLPQEDVETSYASEGTEAHEYIRQTLLGLPVDPVSAETQIAADQFLDAIYKVHQEFDCFIKRVEMTTVSDKIKDFGGTPDYVCLYVEDGKIVCHVFDYKHGKGVMVSAEGNRQLLMYCLLMQHLFEDAIDSFRCTVVQPRHFRSDEVVKTVDVSLDDVNQQELRLIAAAGANTLQHGEHCQFCPAAPFCPLIRGLMEMAASPREKTNEELVELYEMRSIIRKTLNSIEAILTKRAVAGELSGYTARPGVSNRKWVGGFENQLTPRQRLEISERKFISPAKAEKILGEELVSRLVYREETDLKLVKGEHVVAPEFRDLGDEDA